MKLNLNPVKLTLALGLLLTLPLAGRAAVIYSDSFESDAQYVNPVGWTVTSSNTANSAYANNTNQYADYTGEDGSQYVEFHLDGVPNGTVTSETFDFSNADVGTFAANTTYTLTYLDAPTSFDLTTYLLDDGTKIGSGETDPANGGTTLAAGPSVVIDTADDTSLVGHTIGIDSSIDADVQYDRYGAADDYVLTATLDGAVPEPSTWALIIAGSLALVGVKLRRSAIRTKV